MTTFGKAPPRILLIGQLKRIRYLCRMCRNTINNASEGGDTNQHRGTELWKVKAFLEEKTADAQDQVLC